MVDTPFGSKRMSDLNVGDVVAVVTHDGVKAYEEIFFFSHR